MSDKIKGGAYVINLDEYSDIGTHWITLYVNNKTVTYFDNFEVEQMPKETKKFINNNKNIMLISTEYKIMTRLWVVIFVLVLSIICLRVKA